MKNLFKMTLLLAASAMVLTGCDCFKKMAKNADDVKITCTPEVLALNHGYVIADVKAEIPAKYFNKTASLKVTPAIVYASGIAKGETLLLQGEKVADNGVLVKTGEALTLKRQVKIAYTPEMNVSQLVLLVEVKCKGGKCKEYTLVNANDGSLASKEQVAALAKGGKAASEAAAAVGLAVAKGVNTLQGELVYAEAMQVAANNYKNVTTHVVKADIVYRINSSVVGRKAVETKEVKALKAAVEANKANDRAVQSVYVNGYASPDGPEKFNDKLSQKRSNTGLKAVEKLLKDSGLNIDAAAYGEDWEGFQEAVAASNIADKDLILQVLKMYSSSAEREKEIKNMSNVFKSLKTDVLPQLRRAQIVNSADVTGKTDEEMLALVNAGKVAELCIEEQLHIAEVAPAVAEVVLTEAAKSGDARALNNLAIVYAKAGNYDKALECLNKADKKGVTSELNNNYALVYAAKGDVEKANSYAANATADAKALVAAANGDYATASQTLKSGYNAAVAQVQNGNYAAAKQSIASDMSAKADYLRAVIACKEGDLKEAKSQLNSAVSKDASLAQKAATDVNLAALK